MTKLQKVKDAVASLNGREKSSLFNFLLKDEGLGWAPGVQEAWLDEAEKVSRLVRTGKMKTYAAEDVFAGMRKRR